MPPGPLMPRPADRPPTTEDVGVEIEEIVSYSVTLAAIIDMPLAPMIVKMTGRMLALHGAAAPVVIDWGSPDWLEMTRRVWSQGGVPGG